MIKSIFISGLLALGMFVTSCTENTAKPEGTDGSSDVLIKEGKFRYTWEVPILDECNINPSEYTGKVAEVEIGYNEVEQTYYLDWYTYKHSPILCSDTNDQVCYSSSKQPSILLSENQIQKFEKLLSKVPVPTELSSVCGGNACLNENLEFRNQELNFVLGISVGADPANPCDAQTPERLSMDEVKALFMEFIN